MPPFELNMEVQEMPPDGWSRCYECNELITGKMIQYFLFAGDLKPEPTKYKLCEPCYGGQRTNSND